MARGSNEDEVTTLYDCMDPECRRQIIDRYKELYGMSEDTATELLIACTVKKKARPPAPGTEARAEAFDKRRLQVLQEKWNAMSPHHPKYAAVTREYVEAAFDWLTPAQRVDVITQEIVALEPHQRDGVIKEVLTALDPDMFEKFVGRLPRRGKES